MKVLAAKRAHIHRDARVQREERLFVQLLPQRSRAFALAEYMRDSVGGAFIVTSCAAAGSSTAATEC